MSRTGRRSRRPSESCVRSRWMISIRLNGELSEWRTAWLAAHLRHCATCATYAAALCDLVDRIRSSPLEVIFLLRKEIESRGLKARRTRRMTEHDSLSTRYPCAGDSRSEPRRFASMIPWDTAASPISSSMLCRPRMLRHNLRRCDARCRHSRPSSPSSFLQSSSLSVCH